MSIHRLWESITEIEEIMQTCENYHEAKARQLAKKIMPTLDDKDDSFTLLASSMLQIHFPAWTSSRCREIIEWVTDAYLEYFDKFYGRVWLSPLLRVCRFHDRFCGHLSHQANMLIFRRLGEIDEAAGSLFDSEAIGIPEKHFNKGCPHCDQSGRFSDFTSPMHEGALETKGPALSAALLNHFNAGFNKEIR